MFVQVCWILLPSLIAQVYAVQGIVTTCPSNGYVQGQISQVNCTINRNEFSTKCNNVINLVDFFMTSAGDVEKLWCSTNYKACESSGTTELVCNNCSCRCVDVSDATAARYELTFLADQNQINGTFRCHAFCGTPPGSTTPLPDIDYDACKNISVVAATIATEDDGLSDAAIAGIGIAVFVFCCCIVIIIIWKCCGCDWLKKRCPCCLCLCCLGLCLCFLGTNVKQQPTEDKEDSERSADVEKSEEKEMKEMKENSDGSPSTGDPAPVSRLLPKPKSDEEPTSSPPRRLKPLHNTPAVHNSHAEL